jgi:2,4-dienoyl-CoA reductase-like NADH-dependent reductase (Old Yellow Enzyme family)
MTLRNRIVMAPMTRESAADGVPTLEMANYYQRRAIGGTGLIITEGAPPDVAGTFNPYVPRFYGADALPGWRPLVEGVHAAGAGVLAQLWHVGAFEPSMIGMRVGFSTPPVRLSPSGLAAPNRPSGKAMDELDIERTIDAFARATRAASELGFDGVEIHGAHGYLPDQFLWSGTNHRQDRYGGSLAARVRFAAELVAACRRECGERVLSFRISQWKQLDFAARIAETPDELAAIVQPLADAGVDIFHCSTRRYWDRAFENSDLSFAGWVRQLSGRPTIAVGSVTLGTDLKAPGGREFAAVEPGQIADLEQRLAKNEFDLVGVGRALLANPDWARTVEAGLITQLRPFAKTYLEQLT